MCPIKIPLYFQILSYFHREQRQDMY